ncbi:hypothetical protein Drorol1_Dr00021357 [Drosera rotundifolia]
MVESCELIASVKGFVNLSELMIALANNVIYRIAFGKKDHAREYGFHWLLHDWERVVGEFNVADFVPWLGWINKFNGFDKRLQKSFKGFDSIDRGIRHFSSDNSLDDDRVGKESENHGSTTKRGNASC